MPSADITAISGDFFSTLHASSGVDARSDLRRIQLATRAALDPQTHRERSQALCEHLWQWFLTRPPASFGFCAPFRGECDLWPLALQLVAAGWQGCMPVAETAAAPMVFRAWSPHAAMTQDRHGIAVPDTATVAAPAILLLPVVAVDARGYRLGYGGGYFDRTLAALKAQGETPLCIGIGFELCRVADIQPQAHDQPLHWLATENGLQTFT
jgi:5,10-methenyltetrahydrofolate synthetase